MKAIDVQSLKVALKFCAAGDKWAVLTGSLIVPRLVDEPILYRVSTLASF